MSLDGRLDLCVPLRALPSAETGPTGCVASRMLNTPAMDADWGNVAVQARELEGEERRGEVTEVGEGVCCEVTGEVPEEERERTLSAARGTFLKQEEDL